MNEFDYKIIDFLAKLMHKYLPFTNYYIFGFPFGEYAFYLIVFYSVAQIYIYKDKKKKGVIK